MKQTYRVLNLFSCLGGNRLKWDEVAEQAEIELEVTAVEMDPECVRLYKERFPNDKVVQGDAYQYLLYHFTEFDYIWASPPCPSHSRARFWGFGKNGKKPCYPDFMLYSMIRFLETHFEGKYVVENVIPYYKPLIPGQERGRHLFWANYKLPLVLSDKTGMKGENNTESLDHYNKLHDFDFRQYKGEQRVLKMARNLVEYKAGRTIFETALNITRSNNVQQTKLF